MPCEKSIIEITRWEIDKAIREYFKLDDSDTIEYKIVKTNVTNGLPGIPYDTLGGIEVIRRKKL
jgi:hypothetical protein